MGNTSYWLDAGFGPQFPFGYGLSYTTFAYSAPRTDKTAYGIDDVIKVSVDVSNTGERDAVEVVQLYVRDLVGSVTRPVRELKGFKRQSIPSGETVTLEFELPVSDLAFYGRDMKYKVEPGEFQIWVSPDSASGEPVTVSVL